MLVGSTQSADDSKVSELELTGKIEEQRAAEARDQFSYLWRIGGPLMLIYWFADLIYAPQHKWTFLVLRILTAGAFFLAGLLVPRISNSKVGPLISILGICGGALINYMILVTEPGTSIYATGLILVFIGMTIVLPISHTALLVMFAGIFAPFILIGIIELPDPWRTPVFLMYLIFFLSFGVAAYVARRSSEELRSRESQSRMQLQLELNARLKAEKEVKRITAQVAHDIRSPLTALNLASRDLSSLGSDERLLIAGATKRIQDIAKQLLLRNDPRESSERNGGKQHKHLLVPLIQGIVLEKKAQYSARRTNAIRLELAPSDFAICAHVDHVQFLRALSNLIDNALEATNEEYVTVRISRDASDVSVSVVDRGKGIEPHILPDLGKVPQSHGKPSGTGLGLVQVGEFCKASNGKLLIDSFPSVGTTATIVVPSVSPPDWLCRELVVEGIKRIIVIDDDASIHQTWRSRFKNAALEVIGFESPEEFEKFRRIAPGPADLHLVDFEFSSLRKNGIEYIEELRIRSNTLLVTNRHDDQAVLSGAAKFAIPVMPKSLAHIVPIRI